MRRDASWRGVDGRTLRMGWLDWTRIEDRDRRIRVKKRLLNVPIIVGILALVVILVADRWG